MIDRHRRLGSMLAFGVLAGCAAPAPDETDVAVTASALSVCDETVPADRNVDGIPAYAQCDAAANSAIYSNNGVDTSLTTMGSDWIRTQWSGGYQCTEFAHRYLHFKWDIDWVPNGNAGEWCDTQPPANSGLVQTTTPVHGDVMVLAPGSCGAAAGTGHVNVIDQVDGSGRLIAVEQNRAGRSPYMPSCGKCFLHVVANDGSVSGSGGMGAGGMSGSGSGGTGAGGAVAMPGTGGMLAPPSNPAQAGTAAPPPQMMAPPPVMTAPMMPVVPAMQPPANVTPTGGAGANAGTGGVSALPPAAFPASSGGEAQEPGCSVVRARGSSGGAAQAFGLCALALLACRASRRAATARSRAARGRGRAAGSTR